MNEKHRLTPEEYTQKKNELTIKTFEKRRNNRFKHSFLQSLYFSLFLTLIDEAFDGFNYFTLVPFLFRFTSAFIIYFIFTYYLSYRSLKKEYEKIKNQL